MDYIYVGKFNGTHGLKGEIKFVTNFKYIDRILAEGFNYYIGSNKNKENLLSYRNHNGIYLMKYKNLEDIDLIKKYVNEKVYVLKDDLNLNNTEHVIEDYLNLECFYKEKSIGIVEDVIDAGNGNYILQVVRDKETLIPLNDHFIDKIDKNIIYIKNGEGLIDEN